MVKKILVSGFLIGGLVASVHAADIYGPNPVTLKNYEGNKKDSTSYTGQMARHVLQNSLKSLAAKGNGEPNEELKAKMMAYYAGTEAGRDIIDPTSKGDFKIKQTQVDEISSKKNLKGKTYKGLVSGFPGQMSGPEVVELLIDKASSSDGGYDSLTGYNYPQLISKFLMGAVFYNQAVDNYLDELLEADKKPNNKPYSDGAAYTGKEHVWDEAFGYFGVPVHALKLSGNDAYGIAKKADLKIADHNNDGMVDLYREMTYGHGYYAADADKSGTNYMHTITQAFIDGRKLITSANGQVLSDSERAKLKDYAKTIKTNWEQVIAEAAFKYAGSTYKDLQTMKAIIDSDSGDIKKAFKNYSKHWSELKGFLMALQTSGRDLGEATVQLNRLSGYGPVLIGGGQVIGYSDGKFERGGDLSMSEYMVNMVQIQKILCDRFDLKAKKNDLTAKLQGLLDDLGKEKANTEND